MVDLLAILAVGILAGVAVALVVMRNDQVPSGGLPAPQDAATTPVALDAAPLAPAPVTDAALSGDAAASLDFIEPEKPKAKKRTTVDAGAPPDTNDISFLGPRTDKSDKDSDPEPVTPPKPATPPDAWKGPIPEKYKAIAGVTIEPETTYLTPARVKIEIPSPGRAKIDPIKYAATAKSLARKFESDAELTGFDARLTRDGSIAHGPQYSFVSKQAAASNDKGRLVCIQVTVEPWDKPIVVVQWGNTVGCDKESPARAPKCSTTDVLKQFPTDSESFILHYNAKGWRLGHPSNGAIVAQFADDC